MDALSKGTILAVVALSKEAVAGGAPIFFARNEEELESIALYLARALEAAVHDLGNGILILVRR